MKKKNNTGKIVTIVLMLLVVVGLYNPQLLFFLNKDGQAAVEGFQRAYFSYDPSGEIKLLSFGRILSSLIIIAIAASVNALIQFFAASVKFKSRHAETIKGLICNCLKYVAVIAAIIAILSNFGVNMVAILSGIGILSLVIGFGAQSLIEDVITGLFIIFEGQFQVGDIVTIDSFRGTVTAIGIRTTQITDVGGNIKIINNSDIRTITNLSEIASFAVTEISIAYDAPLETAEKAIRDRMAELLAEHPDVFIKAPEYVGVERLAESSIDLRVVAKVTENNIYTAKRILNRELKLCLDRAGIEIPFPQVVVHKA